MQPVKDDDAHGWLDPTNTVFTSGTLLLILSSAANKLVAPNWTISWLSQSNTEKLKGKGFLSVNVLQPPQPVAYYAVMSPF